MKKILIIEDELNIYELIKFNLVTHGFEVDGVQDGALAIEKILDVLPDLIILDLMLPGKDGISICREIRANSIISYIPIIMLTAKSEEFDKVLGLEIGADDYITKPFGVKELCARVKAVLRRTEILLSKEDEAIFVGDLHIEPKAFEVYQNGEKLALTLKEYELLVFLAKHRGQVLTRDQLLDQIWGFDYYGETRTVDVHIRYLRKKIEEQSEDGKKYIETVRGVGYRFIEK
ncbi:winged helix-turn-helix domain-containing protein [Acetobacterium carbinolicum]|jgi:two-component system alkaline phosphatase synthesis response regulator PhoP|uniref:winged helix-turn-helix domain-containing protein n=1 Tax=Acetobacterium TaxID=33951 RepID=UPI000DBEB6D7|nr:MULTISPECIES: response regulator transcription factor [unclassified Acetobacterium]AWW26333.1 DNA-binding response regulator [Acetobacterium sp. KB-1]MDK2942904.1 two-component system, OmpR family, alkaline phosphatase synthesis response regulator PhoP [Acetobacterium sp.]MDZ5726261.1 response regulator transcription factor [Acetobacterium sp. K1/6]